MSETEVSVSSGKLRKVIQFAYELGHTDGMEAKESLDKRNELYFQQLMDLLPDYVYFKDLQSRFTLVNHAQAIHLGVTEPAEAVGKSDFDFFQEEFAAAKYRDEQDIIRTGEGHYFYEEHHFQQDGSESWDITSKLPLHDETGEIIGTFGLSRNVTDKKRAEMEVDRQKTLLETIIQILPCRVFVRDRDGRYLLINDEYKKRLGIETRGASQGKKLSDFLEGDRVLRIEAEDIQLMDKAEAIRDRIDYDESPLQGGRWILTSKVPLKNPQGAVIGLVGMTLDVSKQKEAEHRAQIAQAALLQKNQQMEAELWVARQLQEKLLSTNFGQNGDFCLSGTHWDVEARFIYEPSHHLAGDFFFLVPIDDNHLGIIICDVMGHGVKAALVTMLIRGLILEAPEHLDNPVALLGFLNEKLTTLANEPNFPRFVTAAYLVIDLEVGLIRFANAGHPYPLIGIHRGGKGAVESLPKDGIGSALGLEVSSAYTEGSVELPAAADLFLFTDGIIEAEDPDEQEFGIQGLSKALTQHAPSTPSGYISAVSQALDHFCHDNELDDDICMLAVAIRPK